MMMSCHNSSWLAADDGTPAGKGGATPSSGPRRWDEVDLEDIERTAKAIAQNAAPSSSQNAELASRMAAEAAALEADQQDVLGLGRINTQNCTLVRT